MKVCLYASYKKKRIGRYLSDMFPIQNGLNEGHSLSPLLLFGFRMCHKRQTKLGDTSAANQR